MILEAPPPSYFILLFALLHIVTSWKFFKDCIHHVFLLLKKQLCCTFLFGQDEEIGTKFIKSPKKIRLKFWNNSFKDNEYQAMKGGDLW